VAAGVRRGGGLSRVRRDLEQHNKNVANWRKTQKEKKDAEANGN